MGIGACSCRALEYRESRRDPPAGAPAPNVEEAAKPAQQKPASVHAEAASAPRKAKANAKRRAKR
jgi:hypothetical protein